MWFQKTKLYPVEDAATVLRTCENCSNEAEFELVWTKAGPGIGIPVAMLFTQKAVLAARIWAIRCPVCGYAEKIKRDVAKGLRLQGKQAA